MYAYSCENAPGLYFFSTDVPTLIKCQERLGSICSCHGVIVTSDEFYGGKGVWADGVSQEIWPEAEEVEKETLPWRLSKS